MSMIRTFTELQRIETFEKRFDYLRLIGVVGKETFGFDRYLNQIFYSSRLWRSIRDTVIIRDRGCDLGVDGYEIKTRLIIHHMNPISIKDIERRNSDILDPEFLICVSHQTHLAIHYGDKDLLPQLPVVRRPGDTIPWFANKNRERR